MDLEIKEIKVKLKELVTLLQQSEEQRRETLIDQKLKEQAVAIALAISSLVRLFASAGSSIIDCCGRTFCVVFHLYLLNAESLN